MEEAPALTEGYPRPFGSYVLLTAFAHGGMGEVYLAKTGGIEGIERICVLKKLRPDFGKNQEYVNRFLDEARLVVQLNHANIAHVFDVGKVEGEYYLAMEYVSGVSLRGLMARAMERDTPLSPAVAIFALAESLEALDYAHRLEHPMTGQALNLVHRDVSPHNVMVSYEGEVKLIDFGLAMSELKEEQTESQVVMGKVAYMSPEQARGERVDARCDQFAAGVMAYELLAHERFYGEMTNYQIWQVVGRGGFTPAKWGVLDEALRPILAKALHGDVKQRFATCGDFKDAITDWLLERYPKTTRRTLREAVRALFDGDTDKERSFLQRVSHLSAKGARDGGALEKTQSYSNAVAPGPPPSRAAPATTKAVVQPPLHEVTHRVPRRAPKRDDSRRRTAAAGVALVVIGGVTGFLLVRSGGEEREARRPEVVVEAALPAETAARLIEETAPVVDDAAPRVDEEQVAVVAPAEDKEAGEVMEPERPGKRREVPVVDDEEPPVVRSATAWKDSQEPVAKRARSTKAPRQARNGSAAPAPNDPPHAAKRSADGLEAWRDRVLERVRQCPPCARVFLERADLRTFPVDRLTDAVRVSVETCLKQCEGS